MAFLPMRGPGGKGRAEVGVVVSAGSASSGLLLPLSPLLPPPPYSRALPSPQLLASVMAGMASFQSMPIMNRSRITKMRSRKIAKAARQDRQILVSLLRALLLAELAAQRRG